MPNMSKKKLKRAPTPFVFSGSEEFEERFIAAMRVAFDRMFGDRYDLSTGERKVWGAFLDSRGIHWELTLARRPHPSNSAWDGWDFSTGERGQVLARPANLEGYIQARCYFVPEDLAIKMVCLGDLL
jgi:hypothetical protein